MKIAYRFVLLSIALTFIQNSVSAQIIAYYSATVRDTTGKPLQYVTVVTSGADSVKTDSEGKFQLEFYSLLYDSTKDTTYAVLAFKRFDFDTQYDTVYINKGDSVTGPDMILTPPEQFAILGKVMYEDHTPITNARIFFHDTSTLRMFYTYTNGYGTYILKATKGMYIVSCGFFDIANDPINIFYNNKETIDQADLLKINGDTSGINFVFPVLHYGTISGTIRDAETNGPLSFASVQVTSSEYDSIGINTDQNGNYSINVSGGTYTLWAYKEGYNYQYYKNANNSFDALPVSVTQDTLSVTGIDFNLTKPIPGSNTISGFVNSYLYGVEIYAVPLSGGEWIGTRSEFDGQFRLPDLKNGKYILLFYKEGYISKYYPDSLSEPINLTGNTNITGISVFLEELNNIGGEISGKVTSNSDLPLSGALISAIDSSGRVISTDISRYDGNYVIHSLLNGDYTITANKIGFEPVEYSHNVEMDLINDPVVEGIDFTIITTDVEENKTNIPESFSLSQNYPNPFNPSTVISYQLPVSVHVSLKVFDVLGREVVTLVNKEQAPGNYKVTWNAIGFSSGVYYYRLTVGAFSQTKKLLLLR